MARKKTSISGQKTRIYSRFLHTVKTSLLRLAPSLDDFAPNVRPQTEIKNHFRAPSPSCKVSLLKVPIDYSGNGRIFLMATSRFVDVTGEEINLMKENAIPRNTKHATKFGMSLFKGKI